MKIWTPVWMLGMWGLFATCARADDTPDSFAVVRDGAETIPCIVVPDACSEPCGGRNRDVRSCLSRLLSWATYRPIEPAAGCGCHQYAPCCRPPLHAFFLHRCRTCTDDGGGGIPIGFSYTHLLHQSGPCLTHYGCGNGGCGSGCK